MNERPFGHSPGHARHDRLLVARFAVGGSLAGEAEEGRHLVASCTDCSRLAEDVRLLRSSLAAMPAPVRTRNFRLTTEQAERLRGNSLERFLRRLAMPGLTMLRPVAGVALAMGLTVAVVGTALPMAGAPAAAQSPQPVEFAQRDTASPTEQAPGMGGVSAGGTPGAAVSDNGGKASDGTIDVVKPDASGTAGVESVGAPDETATSNALPPVSENPPSTRASDASVDTSRLLLIYGGVTLAMLSFGVLLLAWFARRRVEDPLLR